MILITAIDQVDRNSIDQKKSEFMAEKADNLIKITAEVLTEESNNDRRLLFPDWHFRIENLSTKLILDNEVSKCIIIRILGKENFQFQINGDIDACSEKISAAMPVLYIENSESLPGELIAMVGI